MYIYIYKGGKFTVELADWSTSFILRIQKINPTKYLNEDLECRGEGEGEEENRETQWSGRLDGRHYIPRLRASISDFTHRIPLRSDTWGWCIIGGTHRPAENEGNNELAIGTVRVGEGERAAAQHGAGCVAERTGSSWGDVTLIFLEADAEECAAGTRTRHRTVRPSFRSTASTRRQLAPVVSDFQDLQLEETRSAWTLQQARHMIRIYHISDSLPCRKCDTAWFGLNPISVMHETQRALTGQSPLLSVLSDIGLSVQRILVLPSLDTLSQSF